jgi:hypothetical protein
MNVLCPSCRRPISVPQDKLEVPGLRGRCGVCQAVFVVAEATIAPAASVPPPKAAPSPPVATAPVKPPSPPSPAPSAAGDVPERPRRTAPHWRRCANHPQLKSESVCPACRRGYCRDCGKTAGTATICPECDGLCRPTVDHDAEERRSHERARSLTEEVPIIVRYPLVDRVAFVLLGIAVWIAGVAGSVALFGGAYALLFSQGLLLAYAFTAINRVSAGNLRDYMPDISDITALIEPVRLAMAALIVSSGPLLVLVFLYPAAVPHPTRRAELVSVPAVVHAQDAGEAPASDPGDEETAGIGEGGAPAWVLPLMALALLWKVAYSPIALAVGAISRSFLSTLNPVVGVGCIRSMGSVYWEAMAIYTAIVVVQWILGFAFGLIPLLGGFVKAFVDSYAYLMIGCTLGLAVFKKARELGME